MSRLQIQARNNKFNNRFNALRKFIKFDIIDYATTKSKNSTNHEIIHQRFENKALKLLSKIKDVYVHSSLSNLKKEVFICLDLAKKCKENNFKNLTELKTKLNQTLNFLNQTQKKISKEMNRINWGLFFLFFLIAIIGSSIFFIIIR